MPQKRVQQFMKEKFDNHFDTPTKNYKNRIVDQSQLNNNSQTSILQGDLTVDSSNINLNQTFSTQKQNGQQQKGKQEILEQKPYSNIKIKKFIEQKYLQTGSNNQSILDKFRTIDLSSRVNNQSIANSEAKDLTTNTNTQRSRSVLRNNRQSSLLKIVNNSDIDQEKDIQQFIRDYHDKEFQNPYKPSEKPKLRSLSVMRTIPHKNGLVDLKAISERKSRIKTLLQQNRTSDQGSQQKVFMNYNQIEKHSNQQHYSSLETMKDIKSDSVQKLFMSERKNIFPIKKLDIVQDFQLEDTESFKNQLDKLIDKQTERFYNHNQSTFKYIETTVNFRDKLEKIDELVYSKLFQGTLEQIQPHYVYKEDEILDQNIPKKKLFNVKDNLDFNLREPLRYFSPQLVVSTFQAQKALQSLEVQRRQFEELGTTGLVIRDHQGCLVTKSGSKFVNLKEMLDRQKQKNEYFEAKRKRKMRQALENIGKSNQSQQADESQSRKNEFGPNFSDEKISQLSQMNETFGSNFERQFSKRERGDSINSIDKISVQNKRQAFQLKMHRLNSKHQQKYSFSPERSFISQLSQKKFKLELVSEVSQWFKDQVEKKMRQTELIDKFQQFKSDLRDKLDESDNDQDEDEEYKSDQSSEDKPKKQRKTEDYLIQKKLMSSAFFDEQNKFKGNQENSKVKDVILKELLGDDLNFTVKQVLHQNDSLLKGSDQIQDKLSFLNEIQKAQKQLQHIVQKKEIKRFKIEGFDSKQVQLIAAKVIQDLQAMKQKHESDFFFSQEPSKSGNITEAIKEFVRECAQENVLPPNLYKNIEGNKLNLSDMNLKSGICKALGKSMKKFIPSPIEILQFNNNSLNDENTAVIFRALAQQPDFKGLHNSQNKIGKKSMGLIRQMLNRSQSQSQLQELSLNGCQIQPALVSDLLETLRQNCKLKFLGLSQQSFNLHSCLSLIKVVKNSQDLKTLDISYSRFFKEKAIIELLKSCESKHSLESLNISFNTVKESNKLIFAMAIKTFIMMSKTLTHLNLSACGLSGQNALTVIQSLRRSKTLQSLHFSGNELEVSHANKIREILKIKFANYLNQNNQIGLYTSQEKNDDFNQNNEASQDQNNEIDSKQKSSILQQSNFQAKIGQDLMQYLKVETNVGVKNQKNEKQNKNQNQKDRKKKRYDLERNKPQTDINVEESNIPIRDQYIFTRILGHIEIPGGHRWVERNCCWICNKWQYLLVIWSETTGDSLYDLKPQKYLSPFENQIKSANNQNKQGNQEIPIIFGPSTEFKQKQMLSIFDFKEKLEENQKPYQRIVVKEEEDQRINEQVRSRFQKAKQLLSLMRRLGGMFKNGNTQIEKSFDRKVSNEDQYLLNPQQEFKSILNINKQWPRLFEDVYEKLQHHQLVALNDIYSLKLKPDELYFAFADYMPPGQTQLFIQSQKKKNIVYSKSIEINHRSQLINLNYKKVKKVRVARNFSLKNSVFSSWASDISQYYKKAFEADMKYSKIKKFIKDPLEFQKICDILLQNYGKIYEVYVYSSGRSNFPSVQWIDFTDQCAAWKIIDKHLTLSTIDRLFIAVNFEGVPGGLDDNPDKELCRYEFFEIIVRMGVAKYPSMSPSDGLNSILHDYILCDPNTLSWWEFRQQLIWTLDVDDLLKANMPNIKKLFQTFTHSLKKTFSIDDGVELIGKCEGLHLTAKDARLAHAYSNMLVVDEMSDIEGLKQIELGEFYEYIARLAQIRFKDPSMTLYDKIYLVLTELFKLIGAHPIHPSFNDLGESESDYDDDIMDDEFVQSHMKILKEKRKTEEAKAQNSQNNQEQKQQ